MDNTKRIKRIQTIGNVTQVLARIISIICLVGFVLVLVAGITCAILPADTVTVNTTVNTQVDFNTELLNNARGSIVVQYYDSDGIQFRMFDFGSAFDGTIENLSFNLRDLAGILLLISFNVLLLSIVFHFISRFGRALKENTSPFTLPVVKAMKKIAYSFFIINIVGWIADGISELLADSSPLHWLNLDFSMWDGGSILIALFFLAFAYIFQYGVQLQEESDSTL